MLSFNPRESNTLLLTCISIAIGLCAYAAKLTNRWKGAPPGPPTIPFLGNLHQIPKRDLHLQYQRWAKQYGPIFSLKVGSQNMVVLASGEMIKKLVDKRSNNYADRPKLYMQDIWEGSRIIMRGYDALWKVERKLYHQFLNVNRAARYIPYQDLETKQLCYDLLETPNDFEALITRTTMSVATSMSYGFRVLDIHSAVLQQVLTNAHGFFVMVNQSKLLDWYPQLRPLVGLLPSWLYPMARKAKEVFYRERNQFRELYDNAREQSELDDSRPSFTADINTAQKTWKDAATKELLTDHAGSYIAGIAMEGAADTSSNTLAGFIKAMMLFPEVQKRAQEEIDSVIGVDRLPTTDDFESLPYIRQVAKETLRWFPTGINGAIPHAALHDDEVDGYKIPAGTTVVLAIWSANNDSNLFKNPRDFDPTRHDPSLSFADAAAVADYRDRDNWTFGAGRRICPGIHVAERTLFLTIARILCAFDIAKARGPDGLEIEVDRDAVTQSIAARPLPFQCSIKPRSDTHAAVIRDTWRSAQHAALDDQGQYKKVMIGS